jgi:hypothetical protein
MNIVITHLTRMRQGFICVAGIERSTLKFVRPVLQRQLTTDLLKKNGGVFEIGSVVELGATRCVGHAPELEDHEFSPQKLRHVSRMKSGEFWKLLLETSKPNLVQIFGKELKMNGNASVLPVNSGESSLGHLEEPHIPTFHVDGYEKIRMGISDGEMNPTLSVTDIRLCETDHKTCRQDAFEAVKSRLSKTNVILAVGLSREFRRPKDDTPYHWLQINNIHLEEDPLGEIFDF